MAFSIKVPVYATITNGFIRTQSSSNILIGNATTTSDLPYYNTVSIGTSVQGLPSAAILIGDCITDPDCSGTICIGSGASSNNPSAVSSIAIGVSAIATQPSAIAIGTSPFCPGINAIGIGTSAFSGNNNAICIGNSAQTSGESSITIGNGSGTRDDGKDTANNIVIGKQSFTAVSKVDTCIDNIILGTSSGILLNSGSKNVCIGFEAKVNDTTSNSVVIGNGASVTVDGGIALGTGAIVETDYLLSIAGQHLGGVPGAVDACLFIKINNVKYKIPLVTV